jgi:DNA-binding transcriptional LysR family regulator
VRPEQPDLIGRWIREASASFYASKSWVSENGHPRSAEEAAQCAFVGGDRSTRYLELLRQHGLPLSSANFSCFAPSSMTRRALVRHGLSIDPMMDEIAVGMSDVVRVLDDVPPVHFPIWLVTHRELRTSRRIRLVFDLLAEMLGAERASGPADSFYA